MTDTVFDRLARLGYAARGIVYLLVGALAVLASLGRGGRSLDSDGALRTVLSQPFGHALLGLVAFGLVCFAIWRAAQAILDADRLGTEPKGLVRRGALAVGAVANAALALTAVRLTFSLALARDGDSSAQDWTEYVLSMPFGQWMVGMAGLAIVGTGLATARKAWTASFMKRLAPSGPAEAWVKPLGRAGYAARAVVFVLVGGFIVLAALHASAEEVRGLAGSLRALEEQPFGWVLLLVTALGLFAFGAFQFVIARFRHI